MIPFVSGRRVAKPIIAALLFITLALPVFFYSLGLFSIGGAQAAALRYDCGLGVGGVGGFLARRQRAHGTARATNAV